LRSQLLVPKRDGHKRDDKAVKIDRTTAVKAGFVASVRGVTLAEYLSELLRQPIDRDYQKAQKELDSRELPEARLAN